MAGRSGPFTLLPVRAPVVLKGIEGRDRPRASNVSPGPEKNLPAIRDVFLLAIDISLRPDELSPDEMTSPCAQMNFRLTR